MYFHSDFSPYVNKTSDPPEFLRQLSLEVIGNIPDYAFLIYMDGSRNKHSCPAVVFTSSPKTIPVRSSDGFPVFRTELIVIDTGLEEALSIPGGAILEKLKRLSSTREIHLQWVPSCIKITGNEIADALVRDCAAQPTMNSTTLTYSELHSTDINNKQPTVTPTHHCVLLAWHHPEYIVDCLGLSEQDLYEDPLKVLDLDFLRVNDIIDLV
ncbi:gag-pol [Trichonephila clavipes]|nr:gag-pol [Trichonephila clavipes]